MSRLLELPNELLDIIIEDVLVSRRPRLDDSKAARYFLKNKDNKEPITIPSQRPFRCNSTALLLTNKRLNVQTKAVIARVFPNTESRQRLPSYELDWLIVHEQTIVETGVHIPVSSANVNTLTINLRHYGIWSEANFLQSGWLDSKGVGRSAPAHRYPLRGRHWHEPPRRERLSSPYYQFPPLSDDFGRMLHNVLVHGAIPDRYIHSSLRTASVNRVVVNLVTPDRHESAHGWARRSRMGSRWSDSHSLPRRDNGTLKMDWIGKGLSGTILRSLKYDLPMEYRCGNGSVYDSVRVIEVCVDGDVRCQLKQQTTMTGDYWYTTGFVYHHSWGARAIINMF